ncbi:AAA family ATPase [uncultured Chitinophaga sp.]|uniref:AAA family ATPase n=1 Tax=uncultured Chitinophaga sp. TaxID=339340 RepID=UPI0025D0F4D6|nr:AAA family ATPase [uncultured Chitinophaga sp.]
MPLTIDNITLDESNAEFNYAMQFIQHTNRLVYLTGKAGTGKTTFLKYLRKNTVKNTVVLAFTGVAAINAGGQTINSFFGIPFGPFVPNDRRLRKFVPAGEADKSTIYNHFQYKKETLEIIHSLELLIIDEISMVRCDMLDVVDRLLRVFRKREYEPFGGVQVVLIGDTFQLPPIADKEQWDILKPFYESPFFFSSGVIKRHEPVYIELKKIYRQSDQEFIDLLNSVRVAEVGQEELNLLNSKYDPTFTPGSDTNYITLATHNAIVASTNSTKLAELKAPMQVFEAVVTGTFPESTMPTEKELQLKEGAQIMLIKNDKSGGYYNGKLATIKTIEDGKITAEFAGGRKILLEKQVWSNIRYTWNEKDKRIEEETVGTFTQYPIKLAWAITVHKSQGLTFDHVIADVGKAFAPGQVYVALSRCTSLDGLVLKTRIDASAIKTAPEVLEFARNEIPVTPITQQLNTGKADLYYQKAREAFREADFDTAYVNLVQATRLRNDIDTLLFRRYIVLHATRLASFKNIHSELWPLYLRASEQAEKAVFKNDSLLEEIGVLATANTTQHKTIKLLHDKIDEQEEASAQYTRELQDLRQSLDKSQQQRAVLEGQLAAEKQRVKSLEAQLETMRKQETRKNSQV